VTISEPSALITTLALEKGTTRWAPRGSVVVALAGQGKTKGMAARLEIDSTLNQSLAAVVPGPTLNYRFLHYWLGANYLNLRGMAGGDLRDGLNLQHIGSVQVPRPLLAEQCAIADYLDRETARIDAFIAKNEELIGLLGERRSAMITHYVTNGTCGARNWHQDRFSHVAMVRSGLLAPDDSRFDSLPLIAPNHIESGSGRLIELVPAREQSVESGKYLAQAGDVVYSKIRPALAKAVLAPEQCLTSADMYAITSRSGEILDNRYLLWQLLGKRFTEWATERSMRVAMPKINQDTLSAAPLVLPPIDEQRAIADRIDQECQQLDAATLTARRGVDLARERRAALISAAVTGKIDMGVAA
jgi:type I restriction enzyme S subunit